MIKSLIKSIDTVEISISYDDLKSIFVEAAIKEINRTNMVGNFKPILLIPDGYKGFKITFLKVDDKKFAEVESLDF